MKKDLIIKRFEIKRLFGVYNVDIPFEDNINIFIGENGLGKTTILNCLNYVLQCDTDNLYNIDFKEIILTTKTDKIIIKRDELITDNMMEFDSRRKHYILSESNLENDDISIVSLIKKEYKILEKPLHNVDTNDAIRITRRLRAKYGIDISLIQVEKVINELNSKKGNDWEEKIQQLINDNIIYLPTYRRIEEDFNKCMNIEYRVRNDVVKRISNMQFGMKDVELLIKNSCDELKNNTNEGFKEMTSNLLNSYIKSLNPRAKKVALADKNIDAEKLKIIFSRLADKIDETVQKEIIDYLFSKEIDNSFQYNYLVSIINSLLEIYEKTKYLDIQLNSFVDVCNKYLENNKFIYNQFKIDCSLVQKINNRPIEYKNLSSGEKQIVSLFSKIYLSKQNNNIVLFDEPELSLSIIWQSKLLPDIIASNKCAFLIAITHSPFIFNNDLKQNTRDIGNCIEYIDEEE